MLHTTALNDELNSIECKLDIKDLALLSIDLDFFQKE